MGFFIGKTNTTVLCLVNLQAGNVKGEEWNIMDNQQDSGSIFRKGPRAHFSPGEPRVANTVPVGILPWKMSNTSWQERDSRVG